MRNRILDILRGTFLVNEGATKNWRFIVFIFFLAIVMISSAHRAEQKILQIAQLNDDVQALRSKFVEGREVVMHLKMESVVTAKMQDRGLQPTLHPPLKISLQPKQ